MLLSFNPWPQGTTPLLALIHLVLDPMFCEGLLIGAPAFALWRVERPHSSQLFLSPREIQLNILASGSTDH